jgi:hypothetical protein
LEQLAQVRLLVSRLFQKQGQSRKPEGAVHPTLVVLAQHRRPQITVQRYDPRRINRSCDSVPLRPEAIHYAEQQEC